MINHQKQNEMSNPNTNTSIPSEIQFHLKPTSSKLKIHYISLFSTISVGITLCVWNWKTINSHWKKTHSIPFSHSSIPFSNTPISFDNTSIWDGARTKWSKAATTGTSDFREISVMESGNALEYLWLKCVNTTLLAFILFEKARNKSNHQKVKDKITTTMMMMTNKNKQIGNWKGLIDCAMTFPLCIIFHPIIKCAFMNNHVTIKRSWIRG